MARAGSGRASDKAGWVEIPDLPNLNAPPPPDSITSPTIVAWWIAMAELPHTALWRKSDWIFAEETALMKQDRLEYCAKVTQDAEIRVRENAMGLTGDARLRQRIRYVPVDDLIERATSAPPQPAQRRSRILDR